MIPAIGKTLKQEREEKKLSLEDISSATKINIRILENLEAGEIEKLPSGLYARSFLKQYADFLGLDSTAMLEEYQEVPVVKKKTAVVVKPAAKEEAKTGDGSVFSVGAQLISPLLFKKNRTILLTIGIILVVIVGGRGIAALSHKVQALKQANGISLSTARLPQTPRFLIPQNAPLEVILRAIESTWAQVRVDDQIVFQNVLVKDSSEVWHPKEKAEIWVGNAGGVEVLLNRKLLGKPGKRGQVMKGILLSREGMRVQ